MRRDIEETGQVPVADYKKKLDALNACLKAARSEQLNNDLALLRATEANKQLEEENAELKKQMEELRESESALRKKNETLKSAFGQALGNNSGIVEIRFFDENKKRHIDGLRHQITQLQDELERRKVQVDFFEDDLTRQFMAGDKSITVSQVSIEKLRAWIHRYEVPSSQDQEVKRDNGSLPAGAASAWAKC